MPTQTALDIRDGHSADLEFLYHLEHQAFAPTFRSSKASLKHSVLSLKQRVRIAYQPGSDTCMGALVQIVYKNTIRIYSVAVLPSHQTLGVGRALIQDTLAYAKANHYPRVILEADAANERLIRWYASFGFSVLKTVPHYYGPELPAVRMVWVHGQFQYQDRMVIITDTCQKALTAVSPIAVYSTNDYFLNPQFINSNVYHVINLSATYKTHSMGYYVSLLASARGHRVMPSAVTIKDYANRNVQAALLFEIHALLDTCVGHADPEPCGITILFGLATDKRFAKLARHLFALFEWPLMSIELVYDGEWTLKKLKCLSVQHAMRAWPDVFAAGLKTYVNRRNYQRVQLKKYKYDLAILINPDDETPPSCQAALNQFKTVGERMGFYVEFITKRDRRRLCEFDALFIRETTALDHHTYAMSRQAYTEGLVVVDDPWSILLCSNKVYLHERLTKLGLRLPKTWILSKSDYRQSGVQWTTTPMVLKLPESSFSKGVFLVHTRDECDSILQSLFKHSDLVIAQEFLPTPYDWRIGIINNQPIFACKYYMAAGHWQIYNWQGDDVSGNHETVPVDAVPKHIIRTAVQASHAIGNGLYGVDLKAVDRDVYVIEINDNPNIDAGIEDDSTGDGVYQQVLAFMLEQVENSQSINRYVSR